MEMKVKLLQYTPEPEKLISAAAKLCYSSSGVDDIMDNLTEEGVEKFLNMLMSFGHQSPIEHVSFTFGVEGVSRSLTHQLVRHRLASYSQQSQRYVKLDQFEYVVPPAIEKDEVAKALFIKSMEEAQESYGKIVERLKAKYVEEGMKEKAAEKKAIEDGRYVFPNACETKIVFTMNARTLLNFFNHRCCDRAQWEIRMMAEEMVKQVKEVAPILFKAAGPACVSGPCPEGTMCCGKVQEMRTLYLKK